MKPGRDLDKLIAERIFNEKVIITDYNKKRGTPHNVYSLGLPDYYDEAGDMKLINPLPSYSENTEDAFFVVNYLEGISEGTSFILQRDFQGLWHCWFRATGTAVGDGVEHNSDSLEQAICLAALRFKGVKV